MSFADNYIEQIPLICFKKDPQSYYTYVNNHVKNVGLVKNLDDMIGKTDADLPWKVDADLYRKQDLLTFKGKTQFNLDIVSKYDGSTLLHLCHKSPIYNETGKIIEVGGMGIELNYENYKDMFSLLVFAGMKFSNFVKDVPNKKQKFVYNDIYFTRRQSQIISFILRGFSAELTANELKLSRRTIESYLGHIKEKLGCRTKHEIVKKAFEFGFMDLMFMRIV